MKNKKLIVYVLVAIIAFAGVYFLYNALSSKYSPQKLAEIGKSDGLKDNVNGQSESENQESNEDDSSTDEVKTVPDFTVFDQSGKAVRLSQYFGKPIVLSFWATWCHYCKEGMPSFQKAYENYPDIQFLMINATDGDGETVEKASEYIRERGYSFPVLFDKERAAVMTYGVSGLPLTFFIDEKGQLVTYANGMIDYDTLVKAIGMIDN